MSEKYSPKSFDDGDNDYRQHLDMQYRDELLGGAEKDTSRYAEAKAYDEHLSAMQNRSEDDIYEQMAQLPDAIDRAIAAGDPRVRFMKSMAEQISVLRNKKVSAERADRDVQALQDKESKFNDMLAEYESDEGADAGIIERLMELATEEHSDVSGENSNTDAETKAVSDEVYLQAETEQIVQDSAELPDDSNETPHHTTPVTNIEKDGADQPTSPADTNETTTIPVAEGTQEQESTGTLDNANREWAKLWENASRDEKEKAFRAANGNELADSLIKDGKLDDALNLIEGNEAAILMQKAKRDGYRTPNLPDLVRKESGRPVSAEVTASVADQAMLDSWNNLSREQKADGYRYVFGDDAYEALADKDFANMSDKDAIALMYRAHSLRDQEEAAQPEVDRKGVSYAYWRLRNAISSGRDKINGYMNDPEKGKKRKIVLGVIMGATAVAGAAVAWKLSNGSVAGVPKFEGALDGANSAGATGTFGTNNEVLNTLGSMPIRDGSGGYELVKNLGDALHVDVPTSIWDQHQYEFARAFPEYTYTMPDGKIGLLDLDQNSSSSQYDMTKVKQLFDTWGVR